MLFLCNYSPDNTKIEQRRHFGLIELFIDGTEIDLINDNNKSLELPVGSFISSTKQNKDTKFSLFKTAMVEF